MSPAAPRDRGPDDPPSANGHAGLPVGTRERGSFTFGTCHGCGWSGPGRRARALAAPDAVRHLDPAGGPGWGDRGGVGPGTEVRTLTGSGREDGPEGKVCASGRERLTARGRS